MLLRMTNFEEVRELYAPFLEERKRGPDERTDPLLLMNNAFWKPLFDLLRVEKARTCGGEFLPDDVRSFLSRIVTVLVPQVEFFCDSGHNNTLRMLTILVHEKISLLLQLQPNGAPKRGSEFH